MIKVGNSIRFKWINILQLETVKIFTHPAA